MHIGNIFVSFFFSFCFQVKCLVKLEAHIWIRGVEMDIDAVTSAT